MTWADRCHMAQLKPMLTHHQWGQVTVIRLIFCTDVMNKMLKKSQVTGSIDFPITDTFLDVNQSKFKLWLIYIRKGISDRKIKSNLTFCKILSPFGAD